MSLAYIGNALDRCANQRTDASWLAARRADPTMKMVHIIGDNTLVKDGKLVTDKPPGSDLVVFLGLDSKGVPWFACRSQETENLAHLRTLAMEKTLGTEEIGMLAQARSLVQWHERRTFCSNCGGHNESVDAGYRRHCNGCGMDHFPRTDPVIIIVVRHEGRVLLGRQSSWQPGMYSALAGFMEPGETIEAAARREVFEEAGIRVGAIRYVTSQPWPFPANIMIGLIGEAETSEIQIDAKEIEEARWFPAAEARLMLNREHPQGLWATNPMAIAHHLVTRALEDL